MATEASDAKARAPAPSFGILQDTVGFHIARAAVVAYGAYEECIGGPFKLRKVDYSLLMLLQANGPMTPKQLTPLLALTPPKLTMVLDRLQQRGTIVREPHPSDRRSHHITLTAAGQRWVAELLPPSRRMEAQIQSRLGVERQQALIALLQELADSQPPAQGT